MCHVLCVAVKYHSVCHGGANSDTAAGNGPFGWGAVRCSQWVDSKDRRRRGWLVGWFDRGGMWAAVLLWMIRPRWWQGSDCKARARVILDPPVRIESQEGRGRLLNGELFGLKGCVGGCSEKQSGSSLTDSSTACWPGTGKRSCS